MGPAKHRRCHRCGAILRAAHCDVVCDPCWRSDPAPAPVLPVGFYDRATVAQALHRYDFGAFFKAVRHELELSQEAFGFIVGMEQSRICKIESGALRLRDISTIARLARLLALPASRLGFIDEPADTIDDGNNDQAVSWLYRRDFLATVTAIAFGADATTPVRERIADLVPTARPEPLRRVGMADVARIEAATRAFRASDYRWGGGTIQAAVSGQLAWVVETGRQAVCDSEQVRSRLLVATADLASVAGWTCYDVEQHDQARRVWMRALDVAKEAGNADLTCSILYKLAHQAWNLDRPDEALGLLRLAYATAADPRDDVSELALAQISAYQGLCYAALGKPGACDRAFDRAEDHLGTGPTEEVPPWRGYFDRTEWYSLRGHAYLVLADRQPAATEHAERTLRAAVAGRPPEHARSRTLNLITLSATHFQRGDSLDDGIAIGRQALAGASALNSPRSLTRLRGLQAATAPHANLPDVADFRHDLHLVVTGAG